MNAKRIVVVAPNWLGDAVMALPAIAAIRAAHPEAALVVAGRSSTVPLFTMVPGVDEVVRLDSRGGIIGAISWAEDAAALRTARADLAILLPNSFRSAWTAHRAGIPERWGYAADLRTRLLTRAVPRLRGAGVPEESGSRQMSRRRMPPRAEHHQGDATCTSSRLCGQARRLSYGSRRRRQARRSSCRRQAGRLSYRRSLLPPRRRSAPHSCSPGSASRTALSSSAWPPAPHTAGPSSGRPSASPRSPSTSTSASARPASSSAPAQTSRPRESFPGSSPENYRIVRTKQVPPTNRQRRTSPGRRTSRCSSP